VPDTLYDQDILAWSEQQADLIRRLAASDQLGNGVDWPNVAEEIEAVGRTELRTCETLLRQAMTHLLKLYVWPDSRFAAEWREEAAICLDDAQNRFSLSMRQKIDLEKLYARVVQRAIAVADSMIPNAFCSDSNVSRSGSGLGGVVCLHDGGGGHDGCDHADGAHGGGPALSGGRVG
jgi:hypothetical protein